jgi:hypothetical protein
MLFDLTSGKRRRVVQVVFGGLALLFAVGFIGFNIGGEGGGGGIFDALGIGGGDSGSGSPQYEEQIADNEEKLEANPNDRAALLALVNDHFLSATSTGVTQDPQTGQISISGDAHSELEESADAWERYLETKPDRANTGAASTATQVFQLLNDASGAAEAQRIVAEAQKSSTAYAQLAFYLYADLEFDAADAAAKKAVALADPSDRKAIERNLAFYSEQAQKQQKLIEQQQQQEGGEEAAQQQLENPFGALGGASSTAPAP